MNETYNAAINRIGTNAEDGVGAVVGFPPVASLMAVREPLPVSIRKVKNGYIISRGYSSQTAMVATSVAAAVRAVKELLEQEEV